MYDANSSISRAASWGSSINEGSQILLKHTWGFNLLLESFLITPVNLSIERGTYLFIQHCSNGLHQLAIPHNHVQQPWGTATPNETMKMERSSALALIGCAIYHTCTKEMHTARFFFVCLELGRPSKTSKKARTCHSKMRVAAILG